MKELFKGTKISFEIKANKQILLFQQTNKSVGAKKKVTGRIVDEMMSRLSELPLLSKALHKEQ